MSTITKEWLQQKIADMEARRDDPWLGLDENDSNMLAALRIALTVLTGEPAAWTDEVELEDMESTGRAYIFKSRRAMGTPEPGSVVKLFRFPLQEAKS